MYIKRVDLCRYPLPEAVNVANEMLLDREGDNVTFYDPAKLREFNRRVKDAARLKPKPRPFEW